MLLFMLVFEILYIHMCPWVSNSVMVAVRTLLASLALSVTTACSFDSKVLVLGTRLAWCITPVNLSRKLVVLCSMLHV